MFVKSSDDVEYGVLGSMIKFGDTEFDVVVLSNGGDFDVTQVIQDLMSVVGYGIGHNINGNCLEFTCVRDIQRIFGIIILKIILI